MPIYLRPAQEIDVKPITEMVNGYAAQNVMLPRTEDSVRQTLADWLVCIDSETLDSGTLDSGTEAFASGEDRHEDRRDDRRDDRTENLGSEPGGLVVGCGALVQLTTSLVEIRSLAIHQDYQGRGVGGEIVRGLIEMARDREYSQICALTLRENFFLRLGFQLVDRWSISPKVWQACIYCPKFHRCDEVAVLMNLDEQPMKVDVEELRKAGWNSLMRWGAWQPLRLAYQHKPGDAHEKQQSKQTK